VEERGRSGTDGVGDDRPQLGPHIEELSEQRHRAAEQPAAAGDPGRRDESEPPNAPGLRARELGRDQPAEGVADEVDRPEPGCVEESPEPRCELSRAEATEPGQFDEMEAEACGKLVDEQRPPPPGA